MDAIGRSCRWCVTVAVGAATLALGAGPVRAEIIDDYTEYTYAVRSRGRGTFADFPVQRQFSGNIRSIQVTIVSGQADDIGYVGGTRVTDIKPACAGVGMVTGPIDVTSQVTVSGDTASFLLRAQENCCCWTGWGPATQSDRAPARFHWVVDIENECTAEEPETCSACSDPYELPVEASFSFDVDGTTKCPENLGGGKAGLSLELSASGSVTGANCTNDCAGELTLGGDATATLSACGFTSQNVTAGFGFANERQYGITCNEETCEKECDFDQWCDHDTTDMHVGYGQTRNLTQNFILRPPGTRGMYISAFCGIDLSVQHTLELSTSHNFSGGLDPCPNCDEAAISYTLHGGALGRCGIRIRAFGQDKFFGCNDCIEAAIDATVTGTKRSGPDCPPGAYCLGASVTGTATLSSPEVCISLFGFVAKGHIEGSVSGGCEGDTCSDPSCSVDADATASFDFGHGTCF